MWDNDLSNWFGGKLSSSAVLKTLGLNPEYLPLRKGKKDPWVSPTPRGLNPRLLDPFTLLLVFSCEEWENRQKWW